MRKHVLQKLNLRRYFIAGILVFLPLWLTYVVGKFVFTILAGVTAPLLSGVLDWPTWAINTIGVVLTLVLIYLLGWFANRVLGSQLLQFVHRLFDRIPLVQTVYGAIRKLLDVLESTPDQPQRVVLVERPDDGVKMVGLVTRVLTDTATGQDYAAVYLPSTPNPTAGALELVSMEYVQPSQMTLEEAMRFVVSGGAIPPARFADKTEPAGKTGLAGETGFAGKADPPPAGVGRA